MPAFHLMSKVEKGDQSSEPRGWYSRGYLPHFDGGEFRTQFITCRLYDSLPQNVLDRIKEEIEIRKPENISRETFILAEKYLDKGYGQCFLAERGVAEIIRESLKKYDGERYKLHAWVVMANHIHLLLRPKQGNKLEKIMHSFKSFTAFECNKILGRDGTFWMRESFDRYIRDADHFERVFRYIENNPVKARMCATPEDWEFSSAWERRHLAGKTMDADVIS